MALIGYDVNMFLVKPAQTFSDSQLHNEKPPEETFAGNQSRDEVKLGSERSILFSSVNVKLEQ